MKVKLIKAKSNKRWYAKAQKNLIGTIFKVRFSEGQSKAFARSVFEIESGEHKGLLLDVRDTKIVVKIKA